MVKVFPKLEQIWLQLTVLAPLGLGLYYQNIVLALLVFIAMLLMQLLLVSYRLVNYLLVALGMIKDTLTPMTSTLTKVLGGNIE